MNSSEQGRCLYRLYWLDCSNTTRGVTAMASHPSVGPAIPPTHHHLSALPSTSRGSNISEPRQVKEVGDNGGVEWRGDWCWTVGVVGVGGGQAGQERRGEGRRGVWTSLVVASLLSRHHLTTPHLTTPVTTPHHTWSSVTVSTQHQIPRSPDPPLVMLSV